MTITTTTLTRAAGVAAVVGGLLFCAVQIGHPNLDLAFVSTTEWKVRQAMKVLFVSLSLAGITGMALSDGLGLFTFFAGIVMGFYEAARDGEWASVDPTLERLIGRRPTPMRDVMATALRG